MAEKTFGSSVNVTHVRVRIMVRVRVRIRSRVKFRVEPSCTTMYWVTTIGHWTNLNRAQRLQWDGERGKQAQLNDLNRRTRHYPDGPTDYKLSELTQSGTNWVPTNSRQRLQWGGGRDKTVRNERAEPVCKTLYWVDQQCKGQTHRINLLCDGDETVTRDNACVVSA